MKVLVLGGGVVGIAAAYFLGRDGHEVEVIERRDKLASETSYGNAGLVSPGDSYAWASPAALAVFIKSLYRPDLGIKVRPSLDPHFISGTWEANIVGDIMMGLATEDPAARPIPGAAERWQVSADGKTWTFHLRHGVYFHTGRLMTAQAAKAAIQRTIKLDGGAAYVWGAVTAIDTPDQYTLVLHQKYPSPLALEASADYSAYIYDTQAGGGGSKLLPWLNAAHDAGTGPYTVQKWNKGQELEVTLTKFGKYWGGWSGSHFSKVVFRVVPQDSTAAQLLRSGQVMLGMNGANQAGVVRSNDSDAYTYVIMPLSRDR